MSFTSFVNRGENSTNALRDVGLLNLLSTDSKITHINIIMYKIRWIISVNQKEQFHVKINERERININYKIWKLAYTIDL